MTTTHPPHIAFIFSGIGSQWPGMGAELLQTEPVFRQTLQEVDAHLCRMAALSVQEELLKPKSSSRIHDSLIAPYCVLALQIALVRLLDSWGIRPRAIIGHSVGEFVAAYTAGVLTLEDVLTIRHQHHLLMEQIRGQGRMVHISLSPDDLKDILQEYKGRIAISAINSPKATVLSGEGRLLEDIIAPLQTRGVFCRMLKIDLPLHSPAVQPYTAALRRGLAGIVPQPPRIPVYSTVRGRLAEAGDFDADYWTRHIQEPVRFAAALKALLRDGFDQVVEIGPHPVLGTYMAECVQALSEPASPAIGEIRILHTLKRAEPEKAELLRTLARLHQAGGLTEPGGLTPSDWDHVCTQSDALQKEAADMQFLHSLQQAAPNSRRQRLIDLITDSVGHVSGGQISPPQDPHTGFMAMGLTSVMAVHLRDRLSLRLKLSLPATLAFDHPTLSALADDLLHRLFPPQPSLSAKAQPTRARHEPIAVIGMGCRFPGGANNPDLFWKLLQKGRSAVCEIPPERWPVDAFYDPDPDAPGKMITRRGAFLQNVDVSGFDAGFFRMSPGEAQALDPQQRLLLEVVWESLESAAINPHRLREMPVGVYLGISTDDYKKAHLWSDDLEDIDAWSGSGAMYSAAGGRISYFLGLQGPNISVDTACSSSLAALHLACTALHQGECDLALVAGVNLMLTPNLFVYFSKLGALSPDGVCKTFDGAADGYGRGEGCGVLVLRRQSAAEKAGDRILALIRGSALNQDGASSSLIAPSGTAQQQVMRQALKNAGLQASEVDYVEAHGTGTILGDPIEIKALAQVYGLEGWKVGGLEGLKVGRMEGGKSGRPLIVGSVKTNIGHLEAAAGIAGVIKIILALQHDVIPAHLHLQTPNPHIPWNELPFMVPVQALPWPQSDRPRIAAVSSFGFSGTNAHVLISEGERGQESGNRGQGAGGRGQESSIRGQVQGKREKGKGERGKLNKQRSTIKGNKWP